MVSTRSKNNGSTSTAQAGEKRTAASNAKTQPASKKVKKDAEETKQTKFVDAEGFTGGSPTKDDKEDKGDSEESPNEEKDEAKKEGGTATAGDDTAQVKEQQEDAPVAGSDEEPKHGTLESGHIYFLYRPKVEEEDPESIDDISKFHILLIPKSSPHDKGHFHRIIEIGKKKLPDPGAKHQVIWGLVGGVSTDKASLKDSFGAKEYETKTRGHRHQPASRPAARGHYILHSPRDELADSPDHDRKRDFKTLLVYEITTPAHDDFGQVQTEFGIEEKGAVVLQVKDPDAASVNNPRATNMPRDKKAHYPPNLSNLFQNRKFIPANPPAFLSYPGSELLIITSPHELHDSLGKNGEQVEKDLDKSAEKESVDVDGALKELGLSKKEFEEEALEGAWA
ncbi:hypothetical protein CI109_101006 [Kwoniella shandongensis]|uniref:Uncharacterized protein n=1 Tax=Kwoniella shandongensis TaxID=1734106 RepID=A0A5M6C5L5_9TREE|nr:uncharacterized protein CI109_001475 [Kwoniella shandongensis]KAA5530071.1 hypothetical protein CI109_001475 [Kwoniella shandongensis]